MLTKAFIRLEKYELFHIRQQLLSDDWELFCGVLPRLVKAIEGRITDAPSFGRTIWKCCAADTWRKQRQFVIYTQRR